MSLLEAAREATAAVRAVRYRFEFAHRDAVIGWASGETRMLHRTDLGDSLIRVEGKLQMAPGEAPFPFTYSRADDEAWSILPASGRAEKAKVGEGDRSLGLWGVYGYLPEYVERRPFWKELGNATVIRRAGSRQVNGVDCYVIEVVWDEVREGTGGGTTRYEWYLGKDDLLPRGLHWTDATTGPEGYDFLLAEVDLLEGARAEDFRVEPPAGLERTNVPARAGVGAMSPDWELKNLQGEPVRLSSLRGQVVVLEFWNTWCFICRNLLPHTQALAERFRDEPVRFFGLNVFETNDPAAYWSERGYSFEVLLEANAVAQRYDVPWQPAVVVVGPGGVILMSQLGGSDDRAERIAQAIKRGLGDQSPGP